MNEIDDLLGTCNNSNTNYYKNNYKEQNKRRNEAYKKIEMVAKQYGIKVYLENNVISHANYERFAHQNYLLMTDFDGFLELRERMSFHLLLDVGHLYVSSHTLHKDFKEQCNLFDEYVEWLHVSENNGVADEHSEIMCAIRKLMRKDRDITLETNATMDEIIKSRKIIEKMW